MKFSIFRHLVCKDVSVSIKTERPGTAEGHGLSNSGRYWR
jgi:hypothetical protein